MLKRDKKILQTTILSENTIFDPNSKRVFKDNIDMNLPIKVLELLELLLENNKKVVSKDMIINRLWTYEKNYSEGSIRVYINQIKKLFDENKITNIKGLGYKLEL